MNRDEQKQILALVDRAVNGTPASPVRPMDVEADAIIRALFVRNPEAAYRVTMLAIAQAQELEALQLAPAAPNQTVAQGFLARLFKRTISESAHEGRMQILERPANG
jgi:hypothetical protein